RITDGAPLLGVVAIALLCSSGVIAWSLPCTRRFANGHVKALILFQVGAAVAWMCAEPILDDVALHPGPFHLRTPRTRRRFYPSQIELGGTSETARFTVNSRGFRGSEPPSNAIRILCIGGSTTECLYLDDSVAWPELLMEHLNRDPARLPVHVENAGMA